MDDDVDLSVSSEQLADEVASLAGHIAAATYRLLMLIGEVDRRGVWAEWGCLSCAHWLNWQIGLEFRTAREHVRVAHRLDELPLVAAAFCHGTISYSKARALCRIANPATEADLLMIAHHGTASHVERIARAYRRSVSLSAAQAEAQHEKRYARWYWDDNGSFVFTARVPAETGALLRQAITESMDISPADHHERAADAFTDVIERALVVAPGNGRPDRYQVMVHVEAAVLAGGDGECHLDDGPALATETARRIACDTATVAATEQPDGTVEVGRRTRTIPAALRRALHVRDGGCRFPGCTSRRYTDGHHIRHWANGGPTTIDNLILLCRHHHRLVHEGNWQLHTTDTGFTFVDTRGRQLPAGPPQKHGDVRAIRHRHINADTIRSRWGGERLDLHMVIENLRWHDEHPVPRNRVLQD